MRFTKIRIKGRGGAHIVLPVKEADPEGPYLLKGADGLGPVEVDVLSSGERRPHPREMVFLVGLQADWSANWTAAELRIALYTLLTPELGGPIRVEFVNSDDDVVAYAEGQVSKMEISVFTKDPEVQITISCVGATSSYFLKPETVVADPYLNVTGGTTSIQCNNVGSAPSGFKMELTLDQNVLVSETLEVIAHDSETPELLNPKIILENKAFFDGDVVVIDTRKRQRGVWVYHASNPTVKVNILDKLSEDSIWIQLDIQGLFEINAELSDVKVYQTPAYWGI